MKRYETYKETQGLWIKSIPKSWQFSKFKHFADILSGYAFKSKDYVPKGGVPIIRIGDIKLKVEPSYAKRANPKNIEDLERFIIKKGDILLAMTGATIGKSSSFDTDEIAYLNQRVGSVRAKKNNLQRYLKYFILTDFFEEFIRLECDGAAQENISSTDIAELEMCFPSPQEQTQIATYLDYKTGLIDAIIAQKEALIKKLKEQRQAIINEAVTKGLNKDVKLKDSGIEWLGDIPEHWVISKFKYFATIRNGKDQKGVLVENGKYPILGTGGEFGRASEFLYDKPSVLLGRKGTIDKPQFIEEPFWTVDTLFYTEIHEDVSPKYLFYLSTLIPFNLLQESSAVPSMTQDKLHNVFLTKPIKEEQNKIVKHIENEMNKMDLLISKAKESIQKLKEYRQSLISEAVTGKIDVRDWQAPKS